MTTLAALALSLLSAAPQAEASRGEDVAPRGFALARELQACFVEIAERVAPSIVTVAAYERLEKEPDGEPLTRARWVKEPNGEYPGFRLLAGGSGVVLTAEGHVLTSRHLLVKANGEPADLVDVETVDGRHTISRIVGLEPTVGIALLQLHVFSPGDPPRFAPIAFGDSAVLRPGHWALAVGDPFGPERFLAFGLLAGTPDRECYQEQLGAAYLQVALQIHPGAYGGALLNLDGHLVGMLAPRPLEPPLADARGLELALPSNIVRAIYPSILRNASFRSPWLGFAVMSLAELQRELGAQAFAELERPRSGIYVENVFSPGPAQAAGLRVGDFLTRFDGAFLGGPLDFQRHLYTAGIGREVELELFRGGELVTLRMTIAERPEVAVTR